jgi:hypothetical protein
MFLLRSLAALCIFSAGISMASRLQVWPHASIVASVGGTLVKYEGRVSRQLVSGWYVVDKADSYVILTDPGAMLAWDSDESPITLFSSLAALAGLLGAMLALW